ncbi:MAG: hypothetical protein A3G29_11200 [Burkholderiales bacterium RIFCSPLOWO2_12_FULL_64_99]|nr:MAG: hypothetical protein A3E52_02855 [Burkholderiales bacterium RIFCSPHIGHO2_12_FULL_63_20]OGB67626.1 MAG: hypothetical protein A3G29_11200 [Burkholderiales bacterium RIFCSPLOWO2_12_FULL_64_99]
MTGTTSVDQIKISALRKEAERLEEDTLYSSKGHFNAEDTWVKRHYWLGVPATILGAVAAATLIKSQPELATVFTLLASLLTGLMTFLKPNERAALHRAAAGQFLALRNEARFFREIELLESDRLDELPAQLKALSAKRNDLNLKSPSIPRRAFVAARKGIEEGEATHKVDKED